MAFYTDGVPAWNSLDDNTRAPLASELEGGYPCGEADQELFNWTAGWPIGNIWNMLLQSGITPDTDKLLDLARAIQTGKVNYAVAGGTANALTAALSPAPSAVLPGMRVTLKVATTNTGPATLNLNGLGAVNIKRPAGAALQAGDLTAGAMIDLEYDGTQWQMPGMPLAAGGISVFTASGTFVVPDGVTAIRRVRVWGGGGGGGGSSGANSGGAGGGGGAYSERVNIKVSPGDSIAVSVGSGGAAGTAAPTGGGSGGTSSFGSYATATGGTGGLGGANGYQTNGAVGGTASGGQLGVSGSSGGTPFLVAGSASFSGVGGSSPFGGGSPGVNTGTSGSPGIFPGGGANSGTSGNAGGAGASGMVVVEY